MSLARIGTRRRITIPKDVRESLNLRVGDTVDLRVQGNAIVLVPVRAGQEWFYTPEWQVKEREADEAIARGALAGPFGSAKELIRHLEKKPSCRQRAR